MLSTQYILLLLLFIVLFTLLESILNKEGAGLYEEGGKTYTGKRLEM